MQVGRVYKLVLFVLVVLVGLAIIMWGRGGEDEKSSAAPAASTAPAVEEAAIGDELVPLDAAELQPLPDLELPPEITYDNPYHVPGVTPLPEEVEGAKSEDSAEKLVSLDKGDDAAGITSDPEKEAEKALDTLPKAPVRYTVVPGDSLGAIARKFYGRASKWRPIAKANGISNPAALRPGMVLVIPELPKEKPAADPGAAEKKVASVPSKTAGKTYTVKPGDSLGAIARKFYGRASKWRPIAKANGISNPAVLRPGTVLVIPELPKEKPATELASAKEAPGAATSAAAVAGGDAYTVVKGDSLWKIAKKVYGKGSLWKVIYDANRSVLPTAGSLKVGMKLIIPPAPVSSAARGKTGGKSAPASVSPEAEPSKTGNGKTDDAKKGPAWDEVEVINFFEE